MRVAVRDDRGRARGSCRFHFFLQEHTESADMVPRNAIGPLKPLRHAQGFRRGASSQRFPGCGGVGGMADGKWKMEDCVEAMRGVGGGE